jgi:hypothetical protein
MNVYEPMQTISLLYLFFLLRSYMLIAIIQNNGNVNLKVVHRRMPMIAIVFEEIKISLRFVQIYLCLPNITALLFTKRYT